jgi:hypothetical protein
MKESVKMSLRILIAELEIRQKRYGSSAGRRASSVFSAHQELPTGAATSADRSMRHAPITQDGTRG